MTNNRGQLQLFPAYESARVFCTPLPDKFGGKPFLKSQQIACAYLK
jgi:hypothetical protein